MRDRLVVAIIVSCLVLVSCESASEVTSEPLRTEPAPTQTETSEPDIRETPAPTERPTPTQETAEPIIYRDVAYVPDGSAQQRLDVYLPEPGGEPFPTILGFHGGGFFSGTKSYHKNLALYLSDLGYAYVAADYRLAPRHNFPAQVDDAFCALAWIYANHEEYGFDLDRVVVMGDSAGGNLAAMVATADAPETYLSDCPVPAPSGPIRGAFLLYAPYDFTIPKDRLPEGARRAQAAYFGGPLDEVPADRFIAASPIHQIDGSEPPFLLIQGEEDTSVLPWEAEAFAAALEQSGVDVELLMIPGAGHAFLRSRLEDPPFSQALAAIERFLESILGD